MTIAFDVDGTLYNFDDTPHYKVIRLFKFFVQQGWDVYIWSGCGVGYAQQHAKKLGLEGKIVTKGSFKPDIAVDDETVSLGTINIKVKRDQTADKKYLIRMDRENNE